MVDYLVVGAGLLGSVFAHEMTRRGRACLVIEKRPHIGGNCYSETRDGIDIHVHGPHIFHTDSVELWSYVNHYVELAPLTHRVKACYEGRLYSFPINLTTLKQVFGVESGQRAIAPMHADRAPYRDLPGDNLEDWCLSQVGPRLYRMFIRGYTTKHWRKSPRELDAAIVKRLPIRYEENDSYYRHKYQGVPVGGYTPILPLRKSQKG
jgi:UDP-galactopyranose mutase